ncbi:MAG: type II toxin-antitoxin system RelE/ParE family toxin [Pseudomonadota bacterium]
MHVRFSADAVADLRSIENYVKPVSPTGFLQIISSILTSAGQLERFPLLGRIGREGETRELSVPRTPFVIVYTLPDEYHVDIERVLHERQEWPSEA